MKKTIAIIMSALIMTSGITTAEATARAKAGVVTTSKQKMNVISAINSAKAYGRKLSMHYNLAIIGVGIT